MRRASKALEPVASTCRRQDMTFDRIVPSAFGDADSTSRPAPTQKPRARPTRVLVALRWLLLAALGVASLVGYRIARERRPVDLHLRTVAVDRGSISAKFSATGALSALVTVSVGSQISGRVASLAADFGS